MKLTTANGRIGEPVLALADDRNVYTRGKPLSDVQGAMEMLILLAAVAFVIFIIKKRK